MKKIRLDAEIYAQEGRACHVTICSFSAQLLFINDAFTVHCMGLLESLCQKYQIFTYAYCFMPDHLHMVISVRGEKSILDLVRAFKSKATIDSRQYGFEGRIFQSRFYDHFIRTMKDLENEINYILLNPLRKGLTPENHGYPYGRCFVSSSAASCRPTGLVKNHPCQLTICLIYL